jgi:hypothetical protein
MDVPVADKFSRGTCSFEDSPSLSLSLDPEAGAEGSVEGRGAVDAPPPTATCLRPAAAAAAAATADSSSLTP